MHPPATTLAVSLHLFTTFITAQATAHNLTSTGCYDTISYTTCSETAAGKAQECEAAAVVADNQLHIVACGCVYYI